MHVLTRRAFTVDFEWRRLGQIMLVIGGVAAVGEVLLPTHGAVGFLARAAAFALIPVVLYVTGFAHAEELGQLRRLIGRVRGGLAREPA
jgi:uncharacterized membrane protein YphA (DoxX/SURF4 family)